MSAELLRRAAEKLREHTLALPATMSGWWFVRSGNVIADDGTDIGMLTVEPYNPHDDVSLMAFIALMDPVVGMALADLLDAEAFSLDHHYPIWQDSHAIADADAHVEVMFGRSLAVARAILRDEATS